MSSLLVPEVSVLFNEPKLLKSSAEDWGWTNNKSFSALQRAEIAEMFDGRHMVDPVFRFQCSSTSRNC